MNSNPPGLGDLHCIHQQLRDSHSRQQSASAHDKNLEAELISVENTLPPNVRIAYNRIVESKKFDALSAVESQSCSGCYQMGTLNMFNHVSQGKVVFCQNCGRLLYSELSDDS